MKVAVRARAANKIFLITYTTIFTERWAVPFLWVGKMLECSEAKVASWRGTRRARHLSETE